MTTGVALFLGNVAGIFLTLLLLYNRAQQMMFIENESMLEPDVAEKRLQDILDTKGWGRNLQFLRTRI